jgi:hypothetical protein
LLPQLPLSETVTLSRTAHVLLQQSDFTIEVTYLGGSFQLSHDMRALTRVFERFQLLDVLPKLCLRVVEALVSRGC